MRSREQCGYTPKQVAAQYAEETLACVKFIKHHQNTTKKPHFPNNAWCGYRTVLFLLLYILYMNRCIEEASVFGCVEVRVSRRSISPQAGTPIATRKLLHSLSKSTNSGLKPTWIDTYVLVDAVVAFFFGPLVLQLPQKLDKVGQWVAI